MPWCLPVMTLETVIGDTPADRATFRHVTRLPVTSPFPAPLPLPSAQRRMPPMFQRIAVNDPLDQLGADRRHHPVLSDGEHGARQRDCLIRRRKRIVTSKEYLVCHLIFLDRLHDIVELPSAIIQ